LKISNNKIIKIMFNNQFDDFNDEMDESKYNIRLQKRGGKKSITIIEGFTNHEETKEIRKTLAKKYHCSCSCKEDKTEGQYILQLSGDHRHTISESLIKLLKIEQCDIIIHGG